MKKFSVYKCKLSLSLELLYLVDLLINKLKTKFNNLFVQNDFKYEKEFTTALEEISPQELNKCLKKVLFAGKKKRRPRPFGHCAPQL